MFGLGFLDDLRPLGAKRKLLGQVLIAGAAYAGGEKGELSWRAAGKMPLLQVMGAREEIHLGEARAGVSGSQQQRHVQEEIRTDLRAGR